MFLLTFLLIISGTNTYVQTPYIKTPEYAKGTNAPGGYTTGLIVGFVVAAALAIIGVVVGVIGTLKCVRPLQQAAKGDKFDNDELEDIFDQ